MRGLPHCHCLITLADRDKPNSTGKVDAIVSAEIPDPVTDPVLFELVKANMVSLLYFCSGPFVFGFTSMARARRNCV